MKENIESIIEKMLETVENHCIETGKYRRWNWQDENNSRNIGINEYGCADAANILYTANRFPSDISERKKWVEALCSLQEKDSGLFREPTHHFIHTTAHCTAALELFDAKPKYEFTALNEYKTKEGLYNLLENLEWINNPWQCSHQGAGIYAALALKGEVSTEWKEAYFEWFKNECDPETGLWRKEFINKSTLPHYNFMAGTFHYMFNHEYARMPHPYPDALIDECISMYKEKTIRENFGKIVDFLEIDWVYCLNRATRQTSHRFDEAKESIRSFAKDYIEYLRSVDYKTDELWNDLHELFGCICALAELQTALPGEIITNKPLRLVLDRRPFI